MSGTAPQERSVDVGGLHIAYRDWGGDGQPIVLLHGLASNARIWDLVAPRLAENARVVAVDQRGHGRSGRPDSTYGFDEVTGDLEGFLKALSLEAPVIAGHSWGANVAVMFAAEQPERVRGLVLVDGGTFDLSATPGMTWEQAEKTMAPPRLKGVPRSMFLERVNAGDMAAVWSPEVEAIIMANFDVSPDDTIAPRLTFERHMQIVRAIWDYHPAELLPRITAPVLMMPTLRDRDSEWAQRKLVGVANAEQRLPNARTVWMEDSIHDVPLQRPADVAQAITQFIRDVRP